MRRNTSSLRTFAMSDDFEDVAMPQPYKPKGKLVFGPDALLARPELSAHIGAIATMWTVIEEGWGYILAEMLGADAKTGMLIYLSLTGTATQTTVLSTVAEQTLPDSLLQQFRDLMKASRGRARERNTIVHGRWAIDPGDPSGLVLAERDWFPRQFAEMRHFYMRIYNLLDLSEGEAPAFKSPEAPYFIYRKPDFVATQDRLREFSRSQVTFVSAVQAHRAALANALLSPQPQSGPANDPEEQSPRDE